MGDISIRGKSPILRQSFAVGGAVRRLGKGLRVRKGRGKDFKTHGKDVPTMAAEGGRIGLNKGGKPWGTGPKPGTHEFLMQNLHKRKGKAIGGVMKAGKAITKLVERAGGGEEGKPHSTRAGRISAGARKIKRGAKKVATPFAKESIWLEKLRKNKAEGGRIGFKKGTDKKWMQKVSASIKKRGTKGKCTPITKPGCTGRAKALAKTFKRIAAKNKKA